ncbi:hypothetical protein DINM_022649 [Dirofilaria immitis]|nr:hypothetical protein [Dirofilaria immitis]
MISGAAQQHRKRLVSLHKTDVVAVNTDRRNANRLDEIWGSGTECFQAVPADGRSDDGEPMLLRLNIGGTSYLLLIEAILQAELTGFLSKFVQLNHKSRLKVADAYIVSEDAYYFQRSPFAFDAIFQYYATGVVHRPPEICPVAFLAELEFWEYRIDLLRPGSSVQAKAFELSSTLFVAVSVMGLSFGTIPDFQVVQYLPTYNETVLLPNGTITVVEKIEEMRIEHPIFVLTERICIAFFTIEYCLRLFAAPRKLRFMLKPLNLVDLMAIVPFYLELLLTLCGVDDNKLRDLRWAFLVVRILRVLRVIRIIKLGRFSSGLQTFGMTLQRSQKQLQMMTIVLLTEKDEDETPFTSIPAAYWWCIVTMTTVGYGDAVPATTMGKIIASAAIMCGVLVLALPITIIVDNFIKVAQDEQQAEQQRLDHLRQERRIQSMLNKEIG